MSAVSITEIAKLAGVSIATVSRCINTPDQVREKTREKIQKIISETGYSVNTLAQNLRRGKTNVIMVVLPTIGDPFIADVMNGMRIAAKDSGYALMINVGEADTMSASEIETMMVSRQVDGIILLASMLPFKNDVIASQTKRLPVVVACEAIAHDLQNLPSVHIDNMGAAKEATNYLIGCGHKDIAFMADAKNSLVTKDRESGFLSAMTEANLTVRDAWHLSGDLTVSGAQVAMKKLLEQADIPTAIFCANDEMAIGALHEIKASGRKVPDDISVVGFDDTRYAAVMDPPLTTVSQPGEEIGICTLNRMVKAIEQGLDNETKPTIIPHKLIKRASVKKY